MSDSQNIRKRGPEPTIRRAAKTWLGKLLANTELSTSAIQLANDGAEHHVDWFF
jgi:hypothetical protein